MKRMRQFLTTLLVVWTAACIATYIYSQQQNIPSWIALAVLPAFLVELAFYLVIGFVAVRKAFDKLGSKPIRATVLATSAVIPYLMESTFTGTFQISSFLLLLAMASAASFWYVWIPRSMPADLLFLAFLGLLWVVGISEEFFFRGFLQRLLARGFHSEVLGLIVASIIFGLAHLPFRQFPNWRFAIVAGAAGIFYGLAFLKAKSVRASMVTHALLVTTWRVFFAG